MVVLVYDLYVGWAKAQVSTDSTSIPLWKARVPLTGTCAADYMVTGLYRTLSVAYAAGRRYDEVNGQYREQNRKDSVVAHNTSRYAIGVCY